MTRLFCALAVALMAHASLTLGEERRVPDDDVAAVLTKRGISYSDWLLYDGIYLKDAAQVSQALREGADVNSARDFRPYPAPSPLMAALYSGGQPEIVEVLVRAGANVNLRYRGTSSANLDQLSAAQKALLAASDVGRDQRSKDFFPLYHAVDTNAKTVARLLEAGADPNAVGGSASRPIFKTYDIEIAGLLVKHGAKVNARNFEGETVLAHAKRELRGLGKAHYLYAKIERYCAWLVSVGATE
jgi:ankyrin repeat protein